MATKPTVSTEWATQSVANGVNSTNNKVESTSSHKAYGVTFPEPPGRNHFNYWMNAVDQWFTYFEDQETGGGLLSHNFDIDPVASDYSTRTLAILPGTLLLEKVDTAQGFLQNGGDTLTISVSSVVFVGVRTDNGGLVESVDLYQANYEVIPLYRVTTDATSIIQVIDLRSCIKGTVSLGGMTKYDPQDLGSIQADSTNPTTHPGFPNWFLGKYSGSGASSKQGFTVGNAANDYIEYSENTLETGSGVDVTFQGDFKVDVSGTDFLDYNSSTISVGSSTVIDRSIKDQVLPVGSIIEWPLSTPPTGFLELDGSAINRTTYADLFAVVGTTWGSGNGTTTFDLRDDRGEFKRGWDNGRGVDSGRGLNSWQDHAIESHNHTFSLAAMNEAISGSVAGSAPGSISQQPTTSTGGSETRPRNLAVMYCVKY